MLSIGTRYCVIAGLLAMLPATVLAETEPSAGSTSRPNLLLISIDTLRADHLGSYGYERETSPKIDAFADEGTVFLNAVSSSSWTVPAHISLMTGLEPAAHGMADYPCFATLGDEYTTLAETLRGAGYATGAFTGGGWISSKTGIDAGFDTFSSKGRRFEHNIADAKRWYEEVPEDRPFFLFLHGFNTHQPYRPPSSYTLRWCTPPCTAVLDSLDPSAQRPSPEKLDGVVARYDGEIGFVDWWMSELFGWLRRDGRLEDTLVVITSDHGEEFYEHGAVTHIHSLYDELVRVPLIFVGPGVKPGRVERQVGLVDVMPTVLELVGVDAPGEMQGRSRAAWLSGSAAPASGSDDEAVVSYTGFVDYPYRLSSIRTDRWKMIRWELAGMKGLELGPRRSRESFTWKFRDRHEDFVELFDLRTDPAEQRDVSAQNPEVVERLQRLLAERVAEGKELLKAPGEPPELDEEYLENLRALGYLR